jgi:hypothetical protein
MFSRLIPCVTRGQAAPHPIHILILRCRVSGLEGSSRDRAGTGGSFEADATCQHLRMKVETRRLERGVGRRDTAGQ